ncbi:hypothetical protein ACFL2F_05375 [Myxococcota bacterium]
MFCDTRKTAAILIAVCTIMVLAAVAIFLLHDSEQPEDITVENETVPVPARVPVPGIKTVTSTNDEDPPNQENVLFAPWGDAAGELGRKEPAEGAPEGPMSFVVAEDGQVYVLDQVNRRVQVFKDGKFARQYEIPGDTFQDLAVDPDGRVVLLDRLAQKSVVFLDPEQRIPLEGPRVPEGGGVTGLFAQDDGVWVEVEHQKLVRIADASGKADPQRPWVPGRHSMDGAWLLSAALDGRKAAVISVRPVDSDDAPAALRVEFGEKILFLTALESDPEGNIYLGARLEKAEVLVILASDGTEQARIALPVSGLELEQFRSLRMGQDGGVYLLHFAGPGATLIRIVW